MPRQCLGHEKKPSEVWDDLKSKWNRFDSEDHKQDRNWFLFYKGLLDLYDYHNKPVFTLLGNHDYIKYATAPWPFFVNMFWKGVYDMNLTRYEAALCYGPGYTQAQQAVANAVSGVENIKWYSHYISPFPDIVVNYGDQSLFLVDWAQDYSMLRPFVNFKGGLHNADNIFEDRISEE